MWAPANHYDDACRVIRFLIGLHTSPGRFGPLDVAVSAPAIASSSLATSRADST